MVQWLISRVLNKKSLIRVALAIVSLSSAAHAQSVNKADAAPVGNAHRAPVLQGNDYNYVEGGGG